jgi:hypothetical protein
MADPLLAQSAIDRLHSNAHELVIDGESYDAANDPALTPTQPPNHHPHADTDTPDPVPSHWRTGGPIMLAGDIRTGHCQSGVQAADMPNPVRVRIGSRGRVGDACRRAESFAR